MLRFRLGMIKRLGHVRYLEHIGEIVQPPQHQRDAEQRAELNLAGMFNRLIVPSATPTRSASSFCVMFCRMRSSRARLAHVCITSCGTISISKTLSAMILSFNVDFSTYKIAHYPLFFKNRNGFFRNFVSLSRMVWLFAFFQKSGCFEGKLSRHGVA